MKPITKFDKCILRKRWIIGGVEFCHPLHIAAFRKVWIIRKEKNLLAGRCGDVNAFAGNAYLPF